MIFRTDTIGHFKRPTELKIRAAVSYPGENARENDLVQLMFDEDNDPQSLPVWKQPGIRLRTIGSDLSSAILEERETVT